MVLNRATHHIYFILTLALALFYKAQLDIHIYIIVLPFAHTVSLWCFSIACYSVCGYKFEISIYVSIYISEAVQGLYEKSHTLGMKRKVFPFKLCNFWQIVYLILELLSKNNSFAYNLFDVSIQSVYLEISYFSTMETYTGLDLHLQYVYFFRNERLYTDTSND